MVAKRESTQRLFFNGINGDSGEYDVPPMVGEELLDIIRGESPPENLDELRFRNQQDTRQYLGVKEGVDPRQLDQAGWGVIFANDAEPAVKEALSDLLELRRAQTGGHFRIYEGEDGLRPDESKGNFLARQGAGPGPADPDKVPYYLLIVGDPERVPYRFQTQLDVQYAVGRIHFDSLDDYANYARSVVAAETGSLKLPRQITLFGTDNPDDQATQLSTGQLVKPLFESFSSEQSEWTTTALLGEEATKARLSQVLGGNQMPALFFSATHGMSFRLGSSRQLAHQGALLCQDWPGPRRWHESIPQDFYFAGDDLGGESSLLGLIAFFFAAYSGGTPRLDVFARQAFKERVENAPYAFLSQLPLRMLSQPRGGALAVIGRVERAFSYSFLWPDAGAQTKVFEGTIRRLLQGHPVGSAFENFNTRYAELSTVLSDELENLGFGKSVDLYELAGLWTANNDARGYAIIGDPAVRLPVAQPGETPVGRTFIEIQSAASELARIGGIGPRYQEALRQAGISTLAELANVEERDGLLQALRERGVTVSEERLDVWIEQAADLVYRPPQPGELFPDTSAETRISACRSDRQWCLTVDALVLPVAADGSFGGFATELFRRLGKSDRERLTKQIQESLATGFGPQTPTAIPLDEAIAAQLLPNRPQGDEQEYKLVAATAGSSQGVMALRKVAEAIVKKAQEAGASRLCVVPVGSGSGIFQEQVTEVASQMIHGIWAARRDLDETPLTPLTEIIFAPNEQEALAAAQEKERILTDNRPQRVWSDQPAVEDLLGIKDEAEALAETLILREVTPPLSVAILGGWGSGKSTVMRLMMKRMTEARTARIRKGWPDPVSPGEEAAEDPGVSTKVGHIYQIRFNAWTYAKSNLWASLMQTIFWELNRQLTAEQELLELLKKEHPDNDRLALDGNLDFQFLYDEYGWIEPAQWRLLTLDARAALQPGTDKNILWQRLRAKQEKILKDLKNTEATIARLTAKRERVAAERKEAIIYELGQESEFIAYGILRRRSRALLGALYDKTSAQIEQQSRLVLAGQLKATLEEIGARARITLEQFPADEMVEMRDALTRISEIVGQAPPEPGENSENGIAAWLGELQAKLAEVEEIAGRSLDKIWSNGQPVPDSMTTLLTSIKQQAQQARKAKGTVESAEELFASMRSVNTTTRKVLGAIGEHKGYSLIIGAIFLVLIGVSWLLLAPESPLSWDSFAARLAGIVAVASSIVTFLGPPLKVAADWSKRVSTLVGEYQEEAEAERQRYQGLVEARLAAALASDEQALQQQLNQAMSEGRRPAPEALLGPEGKPNLAAIDNQIGQLQLEADELRRQAGPPGEYESLLDFIQARQDEQFYEKRLGLMHQVKRDIDILTGGLIIQPQDDPDVRKTKQELFPRGPARVVLYIDDLDRCPPGRVVEVLEAVQLLLDTELFVVVLGLDTRYITRALEKEYKEILQPDGDPSGLDYIEKIIQLPYRVRPIGRRGIADFLKAQMEVVSNETQQTEGGRETAGGAEEATLRTEGSAETTDGSAAAAEDGTPGEATASAEPEVTRPAHDEQAQADESTDRDHETEATGKSDGAQESLLTEQDHPRREQELPPEVIRFQPEDLEDMTACCRLLKLTPRNVKRMVNVLKLINVFWFRTGGDLRERAVKRTVMGLLALAAAYPEIMREVFDQIDISYRNSKGAAGKPVSDFLKIECLPTTQRWRTQFESLVDRFETDARSLYQPGGQQEALIAVNLGELEEETFNVVRSFSFVGDPVYVSDDGRAPANGAGAAESTPEEQDAKP